MPLPMNHEMLIHDDATEARARAVAGMRHLLADAFGEQVLSHLALRLRTTNPSARAELAPTMRQTRRITRPTCRA